jgi:hypothetical protein
MDPKSVRLIREEPGLRFYAAVNVDGQICLLPIEDSVGGVFFSGPQCASPDEFAQSGAGAQGSSYAFDRGTLTSWLVPDDVVAVEVDGKEEPVIDNVFYLLIPPGETLPETLSLKWRDGHTGPTRAPFA